MKGKNGEKKTMEKNNSRLTEHQKMPFHLCPFHNPSWKGKWQNIGCVEYPCGRREEPHEKRTSKKIMSADFWIN
jgi:hypothetical protein